MSTPDFNWSTAVSGRRRPWRNFAGNRDGAVAVIFGLVFLPVLLLLGTAIDYQRAVRTRAALQYSLDATVLAAVAQAPEVRNGIAGTYLRTNFANAGATITEMSFESGEGTFSGTANATVPTSFMKIARVENMTVSATATAQAAQAAAPPPPCFNVLDPDKWYGVRMERASGLDAKTCELHVHSDRDDASAGFESVTNVNFARVCLKGGAKTTVPSLVQFCAVAADSFAGALPTVTVGGCNYTGASFSNANVTLTPGVYCGTTTVTSAVQNATLQPGLYVFKNGALNLNAKNIVGQDVTLYFADAAATLAMQGGMSATLSAPTSGTYKNILMFQPSGLANMGSSIRSTSNQDWKGIVYAPSWDFRIESAAGWKLQVNLVANTMEIKELSSWTVTPHPATSGAPSVARLVN